MCKAMHTFVNLVVIVFSFQMCVGALTVGYIGTVRSNIPSFEAAVSGSFFARCFNVG